MIRCFDIIFSIVGLVILSPLFLIVIVAIIIESNGNPFYFQIRIGKRGKSFKLYKFRSMYVGSDQKGLITIGNSDSRITSVGKFIRKYKLDELPQLINVLLGDMCIVGPRPEVNKYVELYTDEQKKILSIKPGITDYASIYFRNENELLARVRDPEVYYINEIIPEKIRLNMIFVENYTFINYIKIILVTFKEIFLN